MDPSRWLEHAKPAFRMAGLNHAAEAAPELLADIGGTQAGVLNRSSSESGLISLEIGGTSGVAPHRFTYGANYER